MVKISIIIPVFNEAKIIEQSLERLLVNGDIEVIVVDGGSRDKTVDLAQQKKAKVISSTYPCRAAQMNLGASLAQGEILLFLHADTQLPLGYQEQIQKALEVPQAIAGAFLLKISGAETMLRWVERGVNFRSRFLGLPYGDQAIFLKSQVFQEIGGYADLPIMEDFELIQRLRKRGKISLASGAVITSARRWQRLGIWRTTWLNQLIIASYWLGVSPHTLARWYGRK